VDDLATVQRLTSLALERQASNRLRQRYYNHKMVLHDLGISIPPTLKKLSTVLGWPTKAVDAMVRRTVLDSWTLPDGLTPEDIGLDRVYEDNRLDTEIPAGLTSTLIHGVAFGFVSVGDQGEPTAMVQIRSAEWATGTWDMRRRCLKDALSIMSVDDDGRPDALNLYTPGRVVMMRRDGWRWELDQVEHDLGVPVEPLVYHPLLDKPLGSSRVTPAVMELTDSAVRTFLRTEVSAEFYNAPQRYAVGVSDNAFKDKQGNPIPGWQIILGHLLTLTRDEDGNAPSVGQFPQQSMEPNTAHFRMIAQAFAAETSLPLRSLGVVGDNPESADAISEANRELELEIRHWQKAGLTAPLRRLMTAALRLLDDSPAARDVYRRMRPHWQRPDTVSLGAAADMVLKLDSVSPGFGDSDVGLEMAGLESDQIERLREEQSRRRAQEALTRLAAGPLEAEGVDDADSGGA
jgi:hypothetical protein